MACGDMVEFLTWRDDQHIHGPQHYAAFGALARRNHADGAIDPPQTIEVCFQRIEKDAVEDMAGVLRDGRVIVAVSAVRGFVGLFVCVVVVVVVGFFVLCWVVWGVLVFGFFVVFFVLVLFGFF